MDSKDLGKYIEATNGMSKPWLLLQLRLKKLEEEKDSLDKHEYLEKVQDIHEDLMKLGQWWRGIEGEVFGK
ncbi:MAG: hypothetical protein AAGA80_01295 [Cyanobacteria bacterium P01_F01_bin.143]